SQCQGGGNSSPDCGFGSSRSSVAASAATGTDVVTSSATSSRPIQDRKWSISIDIFSVPAIWSPSQLHIDKIADSVAVGLVGIAENRNVDEMGGLASPLPNVLVAAVGHIMGKPSDIFVVPSLSPSSPRVTAMLLSLSHSGELPDRRASYRRAAGRAGLGLGLRTP